MNGRSKLTDYVNAAKPPSPEPLTSVAPDEAADAPDRCGRSAARGYFQGVILEMPTGVFEGVFYGAIYGRVRYDPSRCISFVFEDSEGLWKVEITGSDLHDLFRDLVLGRRESVKLGEAGGVTGIDIRTFTPPGKK